MRNFAPWILLKVVFTGGCCDTAQLRGEGAPAPTPRTDGSPRCSASCSEAFILNYSAAAFIVLSLHEALAVWRSVYFLGHALILAILLISMVRPPRRRRLEEKVSKPKPE